MEAHYVGSELELFAGAHRWKRYWASRLRPWLGRRVLDVGAGLGATARAFAAHPFERYLALEPDPDQAARILAEVTAGNLPPRVDVQAGTTADLDPAARFDTVLYVDVLEHIADDRGELERVSTHLEPGGRLIVLAPAHAWLYSPFDAAVGHVRRYTRATLAAVKPDPLEQEAMFYLDSVGLLASTANRWLLKAPMPSPAQIRLWDGVMVPASRVLDPLLLNSAGKTVVGVFRRPQS